VRWAECEYVDCQFSFLLQTSNFAAAEETKNLPACNSADSPSLSVIPSFASILDRLGDASNASFEASFSTFARKIASSKSSSSLYVDKSGVISAMQGARAVHKHGQ
jgi:hypothetical protein